MAVTETTRAQSQFSGAQSRGADRAQSQSSSIVPSIIAHGAAPLAAVLVLVAGALTKFLYLDLVLHSDQSDSFLLFSSGRPGVALMAAVLTYAVFQRAGLHELSRFTKRSIDAKGIGAALSVVFLLLICMLFILKISEDYSRGWLGLWFALSYGLLLASRYIAGLYVRLLAARGQLLQRVAIYGAGDFGVRVTSALIKNDANVVLAGIYDDPEPGEPKTKRLVNGGIADLVAAAHAGQCDRVIVALASTVQDRVRAVLAELAILPIDVELCPEGVTPPHQVLGTSMIGPVLAFYVQRKPMDGWGHLVKMLMDYPIAVITLVALAPLMLLIALAIRRDTRGPVFFVQSRHGYNHRVIRVIKFRTMTVTEDGPVIVQAQRVDKRVTRVGRFLRRTSLDELPQLINVLRGELSLVGPRPHPLALNDSYAKLIEGYASRHKIKPGITGWAQVNGCRGETSEPELMRRRLELDLWYINNWSPWLDISILLRTLAVPFDSRVY
jgi:Undecaprenyl-phosphate glucose phosphotransferase